MLFGLERDREPKLREINIIFEDMIASHQLATSNRLRSFDCTFWLQAFPLCNYVAGTHFGKARLIKSTVRQSMTN